MDGMSSAPASAGDTGSLPERPERRAVEFHANLIRAGGKLLEVRVLDLSYDGCQIDSPRMLFKDEEVQLTVQGRGAIHATVRWFKDGRAGLRFADEADRQPVERDGDSRDKATEATLRRIGHFGYTVTLRELSRDGCMIDLVERPALGEVMQVKLPGLETLQARVRWIDNYVAGLKFERPIHPAVLDLLLRRMRL